MLCKIIFCFNILIVIIGNDLVPVFHSSAIPAEVSPANQRVRLHRGRASVRKALEEYLK